ncbi:MAG: BrnT family toxin [Candidatus Latescibacteria bacterium]|nr:BrnT family toxin [Candidatus Latescibacterota bacterium]
MRLYDVIWLDRFVEKIADKHEITTDEVEEVLFSEPHIRMAEKGRVKDENLYVAYGQTAAGRYLIIFFIHKHRTAALPISARDMTLSERRYYRAQKKGS